mmetsp:Transcript_24989/g.79393  ORF Transcript_24989/g.79393 Transcript_24989/m.79393 type:complete len:195 (-) Transcript_24989:115-699(-)
MANLLLPLILLTGAQGFTSERRSGGPLRSPRAAQADAGELPFLDVSERKAVIPKPPDPCEHEASAATAVPKHAPRFIRFRDKHRKEGLLHGTVRVGRASCEDDIMWYRLYWARNGTKVDPPILILGKTGRNINFDLHGRGGISDPLQVPDGVNQLMAVTANRHGAMKDGPATDIIDHVELPWRQIFGHLLRGGR